MGILKEYKKFAVKGNVLDMAVGIVVGGAFATIAKSLVEDVFSPITGYFLKGIDFSNMYFLLSEGNIPGPYESLAAATKAGAVTINIGSFINNCISFIIVSWFAFILVKGINSLDEEAEVKSHCNKKSCPHCKQKVHKDANRCQHCTGELPSS